MGRDWSTSTRPPGSLGEGTCKEFSGDPNCFAISLNDGRSVAELVDAPGLEPGCGQDCGFESRRDSNSPTNRAFRRAGAERRTPPCEQERSRNTQAQRWSQLPERGLRVAIAGTDEVERQPRHRSRLPRKRSFGFTLARAPPRS